jgi:hypothetical protein
VKMGKPPHDQSAVGLAGDSDRSCLPHPAAGA